jgi:hypothetical protein
MSDRSWLEKVAELRRLNELLRKKVVNASFTPSRLLENREAELREIAELRQQTDKLKGEVYAGMMEDQMAFFGLYLFNNSKMEATLGGFQHLRAREIGERISDYVAGAGLTREEALHLVLADMREGTFLTSIWWEVMKKKLLALMEEHAS